jgi:hypothetical protein
LRINYFQEEAQSITVTLILLLSSRLGNMDSRAFNDVMNSLDPMAAVAVDCPDRVMMKCDLLVIQASMKGAEIILSAIKSPYRCQLVAIATM